MCVCECVQECVCACVCLLQPHSTLCMYACFCKKEKKNEKKIPNNICICFICFKVLGRTFLDVGTSSVGWVCTQHPLMDWGKGISLGLTQTLQSLVLPRLLYAGRNHSKSMLTNPGEKQDGPGLSPTHWVLWDSGTRSQIQFAKIPQKVTSRHTWASGGAPTSRRL